jgi:hypothetical protein
MAKNKPEVAFCATSGDILEVSSTVLSTGLEWTVYPRKLFDVFSPPQK